MRVDKLVERCLCFFERRERRLLLDQRATVDQVQLDMKALLGFDDLRRANGDESADGNGGHAASLIFVSTATTSKVFSGVRRSVSVNSPCFGTSMLSVRRSVLVKTVIRVSGRRR